MKKAGRVATLSFFTSLIRVLGGPVTILMVSSLLTVEELGFYYTFFSFISMAQLFEIGVGFVLKQYYSHDCNRDIDNVLTPESKLACNKLFKFSLQWYLLLGLAYILILLPFGYYYFSDYTGVVDWKEPYILLIFATSFRIFINVLDSYLDGMQHQILLNKARLWSSLSMSICIWLTIYMDFGLYSLGISQFVNIIIFIVIVIASRKAFLNDVELTLTGYNFKEEFLRIFPLLGKTSVVWFFGYFFWNGFTLLSFKIYGAEFAGKIGLSIALARGGYDVANSFTNNQRTMIANYLAREQITDAYRIFNKYFSISIIVLLLGYFSFVCIKFIFPSFYLFEKTLSNVDLISIFMFYVLVLIMTSLNNFVRSFKIEPFICLSIFNAIFVPVSFYIASEISVPSIFTLSILVMLPSVGYSILYFYRKKKIAHQGLI
ncbi:lipopolysaccharide biosynthesis protein [Vibrio sp. NTOU-M3]|uniref:lipopolysaccharide biosynthesis protein n=1 Tax=Vibrio sp. NTOU-M3 TaxID=3234954 RepID=UPI00349F8B58